MIETSQELINAMRAEQTVATRVSILNNKVPSLRFEASDIEDILLSNKYITLIEGIEGLYDIPQIQNLITRETAHYAVFEGEGIKLDGTEQVLSETAKNNEFGWWSMQYCGETNEYEADCTFSWMHQVYTNSDLNIVFSKVRNEYAIDFNVDITITVADNDLTAILPEKEIVLNYNIRNNTDTTYTITNIPYGDYGRDIICVMVKISVLKWSKTFSRAKITDMYYGEMLEYEDDKVISLKGVKGLDLLNQSTESKELELVLSDENEEYNIFNPQGKLANLSKGARLALEIGCVIDNFIYYTKVDEFIIDKPKKEQNTLEVNITGYGMLKFLNENDFTGNFYDKVPAQEVFDHMYAYESEQIVEIDEKLKEENQLIRTQFGTVSTPEGINKVATAIRGNVLETIENKILIKRIEETDAVAKIDIENMISSPEIEKIEKPKSIRINKYAPTTKGVQTVYDNTLTLIENRTNTFKYNVEHTAPPYKATRTLIDEVLNVGTIELQEVSFLEDRALWSPAWGEESRIEITANVVEITSTSANYKLNENSTEELTIDSESIEDEGQAYKVFEWLKKNYNKEFKYKVEIQDTFTYELGDSVWLATNVFVNGKMIVRKAIITNIEYDYNGALHYYITLRGA